MDGVLLDFVAPFVRECERNGWVERYFFVRYSDCGPHIRLRLSGESETLRDLVGPALIASYQSRAEHTEFRAVSPESRGSIAVGRRGAVTGLRWVAYVAESDRYGGPHALAVGERLFHASATVALRLIATFDERRSTRLGKALLSMLVLIEAFVDGRAECASFGQHYAESYLRNLTPDAQAQEWWLERFGEGYARQQGDISDHIRLAFRRLESGEGLSEVLDEYREAVRERRNELEALCNRGLISRKGIALATWRGCVGHLLPSYLHMMNNRLGLSIAEESYLAHVVHRALSVDAGTIA
jgi:thiopeptide-type bacteriocin biosynthesis protein